MIVNVRTLTYELKINNFFYRGLFALKSANRILFLDMIGTFFAFYKEDADKMAEQKKVAVIMGSDSDWPTVKAACTQLKELDIPFEAHILSAHRTPAAAAEFAKAARANGFGAIICAAGMAAHLAGAFAANTTLPVIGIPMKGGAMDGLDALLATVQMPSGIPVATVALNGAKNAAVLAAQILAVSDDVLAAKLDKAREAMAAQIAEKEAKLQAEL